MRFILRFSVKSRAADHLISVFSSEFPNCSFFLGAGESVHYQAFCDHSPDSHLIESLYEFARQTSDPDNPLDEKLDYHIETLPDTNWLEENEKSMKPLRVGNFLIIRGGGQSKINLLGKNYKIIKIAGSLAFGTGNHATTQLCLKNLQMIGKRRRVKNILDLGTGTGILAFAARHIFKNANLTATDIAPEAITIANHNIHNNHLPPAQFHFVKTGRADMMRGKKYDFVIANILAQPLVKLEPQICKIIHRKGLLLLSGLLSFQAQQIHAQYRNHFHLVKKNIQNDWVSLLYQRK